MTIETKYNIGQTVWFMNDNKPTEKVIYKITIGEIISFNNRPKIYYEIGRYGVDRIIEMIKVESELYITKEDLLKSL